MAIRTILTAVSGGSASDGAVETAIRLARRFVAHVEGLHVRMDEGQTLMLYGDGMGVPLAGDLLDRIAAEAAETAKTAKARFDAAIARHGLQVRAMPPASGGGASGGPMEPSARWHEETGYAPDLVADRARLFDLVVLGRSERVVDNPHSDTIEDVVLRSGRPVLLAPAKAPAEIGGIVAVGWNGTPEAVHAVAAALPFLEQATRGVRVIAVGAKEAEPGSDLVEYLGWHGIAAKAVAVPTVKGIGAGEQLVTTALDEGADLLVLGGWGHTPWREMLFGGTTHDVVEMGLMPLLLAH